MIRAGGGGGGEDRQATALSLDGQPIAAAITERTAGRATRFAESTGRPVGLAVVLVGSDPASTVYVGRKEEAARRLGLRGESHRLPRDVSQADVLGVVDRLNADTEIDGILVQLPLPSQVDEVSVLERIDPQKDVDGFHPVNVGRLHLGLPGPRPCTPAGIMEALRHHGVELAGRRAVVVGRSRIVGKPMAALLLAADATVTTCHSRTRDLASTCREADVLVVAVGRPGAIGADSIKPGATVVDVGMNRLELPRDADLARRLLGQDTPRHLRFLERGEALVGDVDWRAARQVAGLLTPVPGGVGPLTIAMLMSNTVDAACRRAGIDPAPR